MSLSITTTKDNEIMFVGTIKLETALALYIALGPMPANLETVEIGDLYMDIEKELCKIFDGVEPDIHSIESPEFSNKSVQEVREAIAELVDKIQGGSGD